MRFKFLALISLIVMIMVACDSKERVKAPKQGQSMAAPGQAASSSHNVSVKEVIQAQSYTYLRVSEGSKEYWIATAKQALEEGMSLSYDQGLEMKNFESKELNRVFDSIWFVGQLRGGATQRNDLVSPHGSEQKTRVKDISVDKVSGGVSIQELFSDMAIYAGKMVNVRGEVTKFNPQIMGRNWVHLQDGTQSGNNFDLTVTTMDAVKVGDVVIFSGKVVLNRDFGSGYKYNLIIEEAVLLAEG